MTVFTQTESATQNRFIHVGTNSTPLTAGLQFDELFLSYTLLTAFYENLDDPYNPLNGTPIDTQLSGMLPIFGVPHINASFFRKQGMVYVTRTDVIPEPGTQAFLALGGATLFAVARRRCGN